MKKGFTLLELIVVIVILGVLATLGFTQYGRMVERARGAEARIILGDMRKLVYAYKLQNGTVTGLTDSDVNVGSDTDQIPGDAGYPYNCRSSHYFWYRAIDPGASSWVNIYAYRCTVGGKPPQGSAANYLRLNFNVNSGDDIWKGDGGY